MADTCFRIMVAIAKVILATICTGLVLGSIALLVILVEAARN